MASVGKPTQVYGLCSTDNGSMLKQLLAESCFLENAIISVILFLLVLSTWKFGKDKNRFMW